MAREHHYLGGGKPAAPRPTAIDRTGWVLSDYPPEEQARMIAEMKERAEPPIPEPVLEHIRVDSALPTTSGCNNITPSSGQRSDDSSGILSKLLGDA